MAEAVGLAASIVALAGLAHTVLKFVEEAQCVVRGMGNLKKETKRSIHRINLAAGTINTAQETLSEYCAAGGTASQSHVIQFIEDRSTASFLKSESEYLSLHVGRLQKGVFALRQHWIPWATILLRYFIKEQVEDLREDMEFIQRSLALLLVCVQLEIALAREKKDKAEMQVELFLGIMTNELTSVVQKILQKCHQTRREGDQEAEQESCQRVGRGRRAAAG